MLFPAHGIWDKAGSAIGVISALAGREVVPVGTPGIGERKLAGSIMSATANRLSISEFDGRDPQGLNLAWAASWMSWQVRDLGSHVTSPSGLGFEPPPGR